MKIIIAGSRSIEDGSVTRRALEDALKEWNVAPRIGITIIHGGCNSGPDYHAFALDVSMGAHVIIVPAQWSTFGRRSGPIRNKIMAEMGDALVAVWDGESKGTENMIQEATKRGLKVYIHKHKSTK